MATTSLHHAQLGATFNGVVVESHSVRLNQFKGIKYGNVPGRFEIAQPVAVEHFSGKTIDATKFGPRCPQSRVDVRHLLRIPEDFEIKDEPEDEFECLNLDITLPENAPASEKPLPVLIWIYGGSQVVTFCSAASKICDTSRIVADSVKAGKPIIVVSINYRLNIFAFGDGKGGRNLALKDQRLAIDWVRKYIGGFGGDPDNITLAGESAGAAYIHAHMITGPRVKRAILASGSLHLSSPMPLELGNGLIKSLEDKVGELEQKSLRECSVGALIRALDELGMNRMWLQEEEELRDWDKKPEQVDELMIGDTEYESVIWRNGIETFDAPSIISIFESKDPDWGTKLRKQYQIVADRPTASKLGALDFANDVRFALPTEIIAERVTATGNKRVYRYLVDEPNPWQSSARAHHAVDLIFVFGGLDLSHNPGAEAVGQEMRNRWIRFINGEEPWSSFSEGKRFAFGPFGESKEIDEKQFAARRRVAHMKVLREAGPAVYLPIVLALTAGRVSLLN
ncbi:hypothetical protein VTN77DRAFT_343 [Rasamsonia byssochlamydoides]|uniref:uncharacterized protein n=1 Tax=Rasamsonia byssochlamydoides TaxID=89139 RepID=UPI0037445132